MATFQHEDKFQINLTLWVSQTGGGDGMQIENRKPTAREMAFSSSRDTVVAKQFPQSPLGWLALCHGLALMTISYFREAEPWLIPPRPIFFAKRWSKLQRYAPCKPPMKSLPRRNALGANPALWSLSNSISMNSARGIHFCAGILRMAYAPVISHSLPKSMHSRSQSALRESDCFKMYCCGSTVVVELSRTCGC